MSAKWKWTDSEHKAFVASGSLRPKLKFTFAVDASAYRLGAVLTHIYPNGSETPIGYASRSLK